MLKRKFHFFYLIDFFLLAALAGGYYCWYLIHDNSAVRDNFNAPAASQRLDCENRRKIDGVCFVGERDPAVYAVMVDNQKEARPSYGLSQASLVYEAIAEAPITRLLAVFSSDVQIKKIGPVRSARAYYIDWSKEFGGLYVHVGGSPDALEMLTGSAVSDLNEFSNGKYFWRADDRLAPHNVFISSAAILQATKDKKFNARADFASWIFKPDAVPENRPENQNVNIDFANINYSVKWEYDKEQNNYLRYVSNQIQNDAGGAPIRAKNVAVMYVASQIIDSLGRRATKTVGSGQAVVFLDGQAIIGTWQRSDLNSRTRFYNENNQEILFNAGLTWIEAVPAHFPKVNYHSS